MSSRKPHPLLLFFLLSLPASQAGAAPPSENRGISLLNDQLNVYQAVASSERAARNDYDFTALTHEQSGVGVTISRPANSGGGARSRVYAGLEFYLQERINSCNHRYADTYSPTCDHASHVPNLKLNAGKAAVVTGITTQLKMGPEINLGTRVETFRPDGQQHFSLEISLSWDF